MANNANTSSSLMKKTKTELVNIILRKDSVEKNLSEEINKLNDEVTKISDAKTNLKDDVKKFSTEVANLKLENAKLNESNNNLKDALDEDASIMQELKTSVKAWRNIALVCVAILAVSLIVCFML